MSHVQEFWSSRKNNADPDQFVGGTARLFYNPISRTIRVSDGTTPGGLPLASSSGSGVIYDSVEPGSGTNGDLWFDPDTGVLHVYSSGAWLSVAGVSTLNDLTDVTLAAVQERDVLMYQTGTFQNIALNLHSGSSNQILVKKSNTDYDYEWEDMIIQTPIYTKLLDQVNATTLYLGEAAPESLEASAVWRIQRIIFDADGNVEEVRFADGGIFDQIWNNRTGLAYV